MWNRDSAQPETPRVPQPATTAAPPRPVEERRVVAWVGKSVLFRGDLIGLEDMVIDGRVEGTIELRENNLTIGREAHIQADVIAKSVTVHGTVVGTITATEAVHIGETGSVDGNVTAQRLAMAEGAVVKGHVNTGHRGAAKPASEPQLNEVG